MKPENVVACESCDIAWDIADEAELKVHATARALIDVRVKLSLLGDKRGLIGDELYHDVYRSVSDALTTAGLPLWAADELARRRAKGGED